MVGASIDFIDFLDAGNADIRVLFRGFLANWQGN
jgi:hypothetical protein